LRLDGLEGSLGHDDHAKAQLRRGARATRPILFASRARPLACGLVREAAYCYYRN
jgi:hypothetical protein